MENNRIILKASAGTGKTYRLSLEYIANIIKGVDFNEIVVMTFTKKATAEIKERIFDFTYQVAFEKGMWEDLEKNIENLYVIKNIDKNKLQQVYFKMLKNKEDIRIYTIDGFTNKIFKTAIAPTLGIFNFETIDQEKEEFYEEILSKILKNNDIFNQFKYIIEEKGERKNVSTYVEFIKNLIDLQKEYLLAEGAVREAKNVKPTNLFVEHLDRAFEYLEIAANKKNDEREKKKNSREKMEYFMKEFIHKIYSNFKEIDNQSEVQDIEKVKDKVKIVTERWTTLFDMVKDGEIGTFSHGVKLKNSKTCPIADELEEIRENYEIFMKGLSKYLTETKIVEGHNKVKEVANKIFELVEKEKIKNKRFTHDDISTYTYKFIFDEKLNFVKDNKPTDEFMDLIGGKIETIMIDEFQDTSILQFKILKLLMVNAKNIICVGDEKQSIYSWRGGEKALFEKLETIIDGKIETLGKSFRSYKEVIENVNKIYENYRNDWQYEAVSYREDADYQRGYFEYNVNPIDENGDEKIVNSYENIIETLKSGKVKNYGKSCIVCRTNSHLDEIAKRLNEENIPYTLTSNASLIEHEGVKPIYRVIKFFLYENFQYLLEFMRSDLIGGLNDHVKYILENKEMILKYINSKENDTYQEFVNENIENLELQKYKEIDILERNNRSFSKILTDLKELKELSLNLNGKDKKENFSKEIINKFEVLNYYNTNSDLKNIFNFFNIMKSYNNLYEFIAEMEEDKEKITQVSSQDVDAINLMTVHKSKGLEFDTVFYYRRDKKSEQDRRNLISYVEYDETFDNVTDFLVMLPKYKKVLLNGNKYYEREQEYQYKQKIEEINNDYVALTRAKKNLILNFDVRNNEYRNELANKLIEKYGSDSEYSQGEIVEDEKQNIVNNNIELTEIMGYFEDNKEDGTKYSTFKTDLDGEFRRKQGLAMHYYFEHMLNDIEKDRKIAKSAYLNRYGNMLGKENLIKLLERMNKFIDNNKEIYNPKHTIYTEFEIFDNEGNKKIIDRMNIDEQNKKIWIYDYKTGHEPQEKEYYHEQLENYKKLLIEKTNGEYDIEWEILEV